MTNVPYWCINEIRIALWIFVIKFTLIDTIYVRIRKDKDD